MSFFTGKWAAVVAVVLVAPALASAQVSVNIASDTRTITPGAQTFALDVTFGNAGAAEPMIGYDAALQITSLSSGLTITGVGTGANKVANPVLGNDPAFSTSGSLYLISDVQQTAGSIDNGDGLFRILLQAAPGTTGTFEISFFQNESSPFDTKLYANQSLAEVPNTTFNVGTVTFVPEPASLGLALLALPLLGRRRRGA